MQTRAATTGHSLTLFRIEGVRGSNPLSSTSMADFEHETGPSLSPYSNHSGYFAHEDVLFGGRIMQRKPRWLVEVSMGWAIRPAGR
jgi:hypothetical protein